MYISKSQVNERNNAANCSHEISAGRSTLNSRATRQKVVRHFERCLKAHLSFSLEKVFTKADGFPISSDGELLLPDIWVATISRDPVRTQSIVEAGLIVEVQPTAAKASAFFSEVRLSRKVSSVREIVVISLSDRVIEVYRRTGLRNWVMEDCSDLPLVHLQSIGLDISIEKLWCGAPDSAQLLPHIGKNDVKIWE